MKKCLKCKGTITRKIANGELPSVLRRVRKGNHNGGEQDNALVKPATASVVKCSLGALKSQIKQTG